MAAFGEQELWVGKQIQELCFLITICYSDKKIFSIFKKGTLLEILETIFLYLSLVTHKLNNAKSMRAEVRTKSQLLKRSRSVRSPPSPPLQKEAQTAGRALPSPHQAQQACTTAAEGQSSSFLSREFTIARL